jgi:hypothetical protein
MIFFLQLVYGQVGHIAALSGEAKIVRSGSILQAKKLDAIMEKDTIETFVGSKLQIIFKDKTTITLAEQTKFDLQEYLFDDASNSKMEFQVKKGFFKTITGKIGKIAKDRFRVKTANAYIGIRGTHFSGLIAQDKEKIICHKGSIVVTSVGKSVQLFEGELLLLKSGEPPKEIRKYNESDLKNSYSFAKIDHQVANLVSKAVSTIDIFAQDVMDANLQNQIYDKINSIANQNDKSANYNMYLDQSLQEAYTQLSSVYYETVVSGFAINSYTEQFSDYTPLSYTLFSVDEPKSASAEDILQATPFQTWRHEENTPRTPEEKIVEYMGGVNAFSKEIYKHWDGRASGRKITIHDGNILGVVTNTSDYVDRVSLIDPVENYARVIIDYGNQLIYANLKFNANDPITLQKQYWDFAISSSDVLSVSSTGFYADGEDFYNLQGYKVYDASRLLYGRFYGDEIEQVAADFALSLNAEGVSMDEYDPYDTRFTFGTFAANSIESYDVEQIFVGEDDYFSWGYWDSGDPLGTNGAWVKPKIANTAQETIQQFEANKQIYTYTGGIIGSYFRPVEYSPTEVLQGEFSFAMDFGNGSWGGEAYVEAVEDKYLFSIENGVVNQKGFYSDKYLYKGSQDVKNMDISGEFFGENGEKIGGGIRFETVKGNVGLGAFAGTKQ